MKQLLNGYEAPLSTQTFLLYRYHAYPFSLWCNSAFENFLNTLVHKITIDLFKRRPQILIPLLWRSVVQFYLANKKFTAVILKFREL
jgi:hypothetical protein